MKEELKLDNQLCFPLYAVSRLMTKAYQPLLAELGLSYPQYLVLLVLWETDKIPVMQIGEKLFLSSNTLTPLLKRMETGGIITREKSREDERVVLVCLTPKGEALEEKAAMVPQQLGMNITRNFDPDRAMQLRDDLKELIKALK